jgi:Transcriptional regulators
MDSKDRLAKAMSEFTEAISQREMMEFFRYASDHNLPPQQLGAVVRIGRGGPQGMTRMASRFGRTGAAVSQMVNRLVVQGLVERREAPEDRREKRIRLTAKGSRILAEFDEARKVWMRGLVEGLGPEETERAVQALETLARSIREQEFQKERMEK